MRAAHGWSGWFGALLCLSGAVGVGADEPVVAAADSAALRVLPEMLLLSGGDFTMGRDETGPSAPAHRVRVSPFYLDRHEVTNAEYLAFCRAAGHRLPEFWGMDVYCSGPQYPDHPVVGVSWGDALAYARWRGVRLPTEAEWEYAARGGLEGKKYANGDELDPALYGPSGLTGTAAPFRVDSLPPNGFGLYGMTGNVSEWVADLFEEHYYEHSPAQDPRGAYVGLFRVIRGGGWHTGPGCLGVHYRNALSSNRVDFNIGFRCAKYAGEPAAAMMEQAIADSGLVGGMRFYTRMLAAAPGSYYFAPREFNEMAYRLVRAGKLAEALEVLRLNAANYPDWYEAYDSLGEIHLKQGDREQAISKYRRALELNPYCETAQHALDSLGVAR